MSLLPKNFLPVEVVFHASWWHRHYGFRFDEGFFFDPDRRVECERRMRQILHDRFGDLGLGETNAKPRPVVGPVHLASGPLERAAVCCINMDDKTPDKNVRAIFDTVADYRRYGA